MTEFNVAAQVMNDIVKLIKWFKSINILKSVIQMYD